MPVRAHPEHDGHDPPGDQQQGACGGDGGERGPPSLALGVSRVSPTTASAAVNAATMSVSGTDTKFEVMNWNMAMTLDYLRAA